MTGRRNYVKTRTAEMWLTESGVVHINILPSTRMSLADNHENIRHVPALFEGRKRPVYSDIRYMISADRESRQFAASEEIAAWFAALALNTNSHIARVIGNFFIRLSRPPYPTRMFNSESEAMEWLAQFVENEQPV